MKELYRTINLPEISWLQALLAEAGIDSVVLDGNTSILMQGMMNIAPRIMVLDEDFETARDIFAKAKAAL